MLEAVVWIDLEAESPQLLMVPLGARYSFGTPMSAFGTHRTT